MQTEGGVPCFTQTVTSDVDSVLTGAYVESLDCALIYLLTRRERKCQHAAMGGSDVQVNPIDCVSRASSSGRCASVYRNQGRMSCEAALSPEVLEPEVQRMRLFAWLEHTYILKNVAVLQGLPAVWLITILLFYIQKIKRTLTEINILWATDPIIFLCSVIILSCDDANCLLTYGVAIRGNS